MSTSSLYAPARERFEVSPGIQAIESTSDDVFLENIFTEFLRSYCKVYEENIPGDTSFAQIAIEYEIETLPLRYKTNVMYKIPHTVSGHGARVCGDGPNAICCQD